MKMKTIAAAASLMALPALSFAAAPTLGDVLGASGITASGHASAGFFYQKTTPPSPAPKVTANSFTFDQAELMFAKTPADGFGATVDIFAGQDVAGGGAPFAPAFNKFGAGGEVNLHQAFVQYSSGGLTVVGGKFATLAGSEVASDAANVNATRSLLFGFQPLTLTGVRAGYKFGDMITAYAGLSNAVGGATVDFNKQKTTELGVALTPATGVTVALTDYIGNELPGGGQKTNLLDLVAGFTAGPLSLGLNADYQTVKTNAVTNQKNSGVALYANFQVVPAFRAGVRAEATTAKDTVPVPNTKFKANEFTLTGDYTAASNFDVLGDLRFDQMKNDVTGAKTKLTTFLVKGIYKF